LIYDVETMHFCQLFIHTQVLRSYSVTHFLSSLVQKSWVNVNQNYNKK